MARARRVNQLMAHHGRHSRAELAIFPKASPVLSLRLDGVNIAITSWNGQHVSATDVAFARELARRAAAYALEVERRFRGLTPVGAAGEGAAR
jgi:hypothetical protein